MKKLLMVVVLFSGMTQDVYANVKNFDIKKIQGNYMDSCFDCQTDGNLLTCSCYADSMRFWYKITNVDLGRITDDFSWYVINANENLMLKQSKYKAKNFGGSIWNKCTQCAMNAKYTLKCLCSGKLLSYDDVTKGCPSMQFGPNDNMTALQCTGKK